MHIIECSKQHQIPALNFTSNINNHQSKNETQAEQQDPSNPNINLLNNSTIVDYLEQMSCGQQERKINSHSIDNDEILNQLLHSRSLCLENLK